VGTGGERDGSTRAEAERPGIAASIGEIRELELRLAGLRRALLAGGAPRTDGEEGASGFELLVVRSGDHLLALSLAFVEEVVQMPALAPVPGGGRALAGLVDYHGEVLAVIDLGRLVGGQPTPVVRSQSLVICEVGGRRLAVQVGEVVDVASVAGARVRVTEELLPGALRTAGVVTIDGVTAHLIDLAWIAMGTELADIVAADGTSAARRSDPPGPAR
jgi:purine-binding chemotaxis protein CheW